MSTVEMLILLVGAVGLIGILVDTRIKDRRATEKYWNECREDYKNSA